MTLSLPLTSLILLLAVLLGYFLAARPLIRRGKPLAGILASLTIVLLTGVFLSTMPYLDFLSCKARDCARSPQVCAASMCGEWTGLAILANLLLALIILILDALFLIWIARRSQPLTGSKKRVTDNPDMEVHQHD